MDYEAEQIANEEQYGKEQCNKIIRQCLEETGEIQLMLDGFAEGDDDLREFGTTVLTQMALHKSIQAGALVGTLIGRYGDAHVIACCIEELLEIGLINCDALHPTRLIAAFLPNQEQQDKIDNFRTRLPMIIEPKKAKFKNAGAYKVPVPCVLNQFDDWEGDICLESIDRKNKTAYSINTEVVINTCNKTKKGLAKKPNESEEEWEDRVKQWNNFTTLVTQDIAKVVNYGNKFNLLHQNDKRGRLYDSGYSIKYQGNTYQKACIEFFNKELIND